MDYAFLSKEGRGSQVVMEKAKGSREPTCAVDMTRCVHTRCATLLIDFYVLFNNLQDIIIYLPIFYNYPITYTGFQKPSVTIGYFPNH